MKHIAVFASGSGTNAENIIKYFKNTKTASVVLVLTNNPKALVLERAAALEVKTVVFNKTQLNDAKWGIDNLADIDLIVLAGFLWKFPEHLLGTYKNKVVNIHPALLPKYGGKGMYGMHVHDAVVKNNESETGVTIHYVNEHYDEGAIVFQAKCAVHKTDSSTEVAAKIHQLEMEHFPKVIQNILLSDV
ncbi:MAG: Phosphoribosylglycinamide formyltransferase [Formosa sp. Hel1_33_131]|mgnify:CR=1 FL=1|nr:MAG: Phosphoribosylglycinamide formyltransferase [Formosa sp. Hel1_33_131]|tara:strand:- start:2062 stop:2628 length:567 start_codon:yes stop_codon:yes gene_type:complete